ncbi:MAG: family 78 glycoside hydrolase catalytic domain [Clostridia bacterium]|nr:family 78 glycoside hydrolase catalytic domain [Clostridia bacterium]
MKKFKNARWIWQNNNNNIDEYVEFYFNFAKPSNNKVLINLAVDSNYVIYLNNTVVGFGQYADYPDYKIFDTIDLSNQLNDINEIKLIVWYYGIETQTYKKDLPGAIFEVVSGEKILVSSNEKIDCRICRLYENYRNKKITVQLGQSFKYYGNTVVNEPYSKAVLINKSKNLYPRPNNKLIVSKRQPISIKDYGDSYLIDLGQETVGFIEFDFESSEQQEILVSYGEYLFNNQVRRIINNEMDYSVEYVAKKGVNQYCNYFRRIAGRYLQVYFNKPIKIDYIGIRPVMYPIMVKENVFKSELHRKIYDTCLHTLLSCMHEHFEDCPWREQALYTLDSRNEMLAAYSAFDDYKFIRSNLTLIAHGVRDDGLLTICYPTGLDFPIPFFSLAYAIQLCEYIDRSGDLSILDETFDSVSTVMNTFISRIDESGLIDAFPCPYWNFYEWSHGSVDVEHNSRIDPNEKLNKYDLILNCMFLHSLHHYKKICDYKGVEFDFDESRIIKAIKETFYDTNIGLYKATTQGKPFYTVLGNSLVILSGIGDEKLAENILSSKIIVPITLSMSTFLYEALLKVNGAKYKEFILFDIDKKYSNMLKKGATTFWETEDGASALCDTGSLCHGWSAMPIHYYNLLNQEQYFNGEL